MNSYEITLVEKRSKTLLVNADCSTDALISVENQYIDGTINLEDCEIELDDVICREAHPGVFDIGEPTDEAIEEIYCESCMDCNCDKIFECENCANKSNCSNETKYEHLTELLIDEFVERMAMVYSTYGEE